MFNPETKKRLGRFYEKISLVFHKVGLLQFAEFDAIEIKDEHKLLKTNATVSFCPIEENICPLKRYFFIETHWKKMDEEKMVGSLFLSSLLTSKKFTGL